MSIRFRLNALIVAVFSLGLILLVFAMVIGAGPRIQAENDSTMRLGKEFVETTIDSLQGTTDPGARLKVLLDGLKQLRHVHIYRIDDPLPSVEPEATPDGGAPEWLMRMGGSTPGDKVPVVVNGVDFGTLVIAPRLADEAAEVWSSIVNFTLGGTALAIAAVFLMSATIAYLLRPIRQIGDALMVLESGKYDVVVPEKGPPEIPTSAASSTGSRPRWKPASPKTAGSPNASFAYKTRSARNWPASCMTSSALTTSPSGPRSAHSNRRRSGTPRIARSCSATAIPWSSAWRRSSA